MMKENMIISHVRSEHMSRLNHESLSTRGGVTFASNMSPWPKQLHQSMRRGKTAANKNPEDYAAKFSKVEGYDLTN